MHTYKLQWEPYVYSLRGMCPCVSIQVPLYDTSAIVLYKCHCTIVCICIPGYWPSRTTKAPLRRCYRSHVVLTDNKHSPWTLQTCRMKFHCPWKSIKFHGAPSTPTRYRVQTNLNYWSLWARRRMQTAGGNGIQQWWERIALGTRILFTLNVAVYVVGLCVPQNWMLR